MIKTRKPNCSVCGVKKSEDNTRTTIDSKNGQRYYQTACRKCSAIKQRKYNEAYKNKGHDTIKEAERTFSRKNSNHFIIAKAARYLGNPKIYLDFCADFAKENLMEY